MRDGVNFVKLHSNHTRQDRVISVENDTPALYNIDILVLDEALSSPSWAIWMWVVIAVEDGNNVGLDVEREEVVDVVRLGLGLLYLHNSEI